MLIRVMAKVTGLSDMALGPLVGFLCSLLIIGQASRLDKREGIGRGFFFSLKLCANYKA